MGGKKKRSSEDQELFILFKQHRAPFMEYIQSERLKMDAEADAEAKAEAERKKLKQELGQDFYAMLYAREGDAFWDSSLNLAIMQLGALIGTYDQSMLGVVVFLPKLKLLCCIGQDGEGKPLQLLVCAVLAGKKKSWKNHGGAAKQVKGGLLSFELEGGAVYAVSDMQHVGLEGPNGHALLLLPNTPGSGPLRLAETYWKEEEEEEYVVCSPTYGP